MSYLSVKPLKASLLLLALVSLAPLRAADKEKSPYIGLTKEQVYARLGDARNSIRVGTREVMFFSKVKLTLRNNVVVETEEIDETTSVVKRPATPAPEVVTPVTPTPAAPVVDAAVAAAEAAEIAKARKFGSSQAAAPVTPEPAARSTEAKASAPSYEIKAVNPTSTPRTTTKSTGGSTVAPRAVTVNPATPPPVAKAPVPAPAPKQGQASAPVSTTSVATNAGTSGGATTGTVPPATALDPAATPGAGVAMTDEKKEGAETPEAAAPAETAPKKKTVPSGFFRRRHSDPDGDLPAVTIFTTQTIIFAVGVVGAIGFLIWRGRNRKILLDATTVSNTPFKEAAVADSGAQFTADFIAKLEWKRFEELVAAYYVKTGVIATRTKAGPDAPVHLKISWKGETKPFACVQCHSNPVGLIRSGPLLALHAELATADIRRGYVVTNGKFNVEARDVAEEKHFTLLPGDILLEKLNALPPAARAEIMQQITTGDFTTASCPKCDTKMVHSDDGSWRCPKCETVLPGKKA